MLNSLDMPSLVADDWTHSSLGHSPASYNYSSRTSADKQSPTRENAEPPANGNIATMNGRLPNGSTTMSAVPNGRPLQPTTPDRTLTKKDSSVSDSRGWGSDHEGPGKPSETRGDAEYRSSRDDGYFASIHNGETQDRFGTTHVKLGSIDPVAATKYAQKDLDSAAAARHDGDVTSLSKSSLSAPNSASTSDANNSTYRVSSPAAFNHNNQALAANQQPYRLQHRHTLEVPKVSTSRPREFQHPASTDDVVTASGRFSPNTPTRRRGSMSLARRATRSVNSDMHLDEVPQDEDAARWADHIRQKRASKRRRKDDEDDDRVVMGTKVDQTHVNWITAYNMLTGIRFTVSRTNAKMDRELTGADFEAKHKFSFDITGNELTPSAKYDFKFKDYAPWVFRHLRATFGLDPADYLVSLTSKYILSELGSPGKSGSFFYFSRDYKYIIKTIHHGEHKFLRKILKEYYDHVQENPNTLLSQFYGLHRVKIPYGRKIHFVVMNNLFPPHRDIHRTFDLKGSTIGRDFKEEDLDKNPRATLKDLNWLRRNLHLEFGPTKKKAFIEQMQKDVKLLQKLHVMDYSLLIGIHDLERGNEDNLRDKTLQVFQPGGETSEEPAPSLLARTPSKLEHARKAKELRQMIKTQKPIPMEQATNKMPDELEDARKNSYFYSDDGGFRATHEDDTDGEEIYYLGIIDCLTHYGFIKRAEHFFKGLTSQEGQISAIPPERYGDRFIKFISGVTKTREAAEREKAQQVDGTVNDPLLSGINITHKDREATEAVMEQAQAQASRSQQRGSSESDAPSREMRAVRSPSADRGELGTTLPVVEEAMESSSTGGRSGRSMEPDCLPPPPPLKDSDRGLPHDRQRDNSLQRPPPTPPKDSANGDYERRPPTPPKDTYPHRQSSPPTPPKEERGRGRGKDKELPHPPMEPVVRVN